MRAVKTLARRFAPKLYDRAIRIASSSTSRNLTSFRDRWRFERVVRSGQPFCVDVCGRSGFGGMLSSVIRVHYFLSETPGLKRVASSNPLYVDKNISADVLDMFFDRESHMEDPCAIFPFRFPQDITLQCMDKSLTIAGVHDLFRRNYVIKERFLAEAREFFTSSFDRALGVHFRGSDKRLEATRIEFEAYTKTIDVWMEATGVDDLFIATDEREFLAAMQRRYGTKRAKGLDCRYYSDGVRGSHYFPGSGFEKGREALLTILTLSMCDVCIRGASHLSAWSKFLNPKLPIVMLGNPSYSSGFPENEMLRCALKSPLELGTSIANTHSS